MPIDTSIYGNLQPAPQIQAPNPLASAQQAMQLGQAAMQQMQMARQLRTQSDIQDAYMRNTDPQTGQLDQQGVLTTLGQRNPLAAQQVSQGFTAQNEAKAKAATAQADYVQKLNDVVGPTYEYMDKNVPADQRPDVWPQMVQHLKDAGLNTDHISPTYNEQDFQQHLATWRNSPLNLANQKTQSETAKNLAEAGPMGAAKLGSELYGSRSPNAELSNQYSTDVKPIRNSQIFMQQMLDSHANKTPQGDAALVLNNFKIRNPGATDVNSIEEMKSSQSVGDAWKNKISQALNGGFDDATRDNLLRDGISAYRANMDSFRGIQKRYQARASVQGVNDPTLTYEPAIEDTNKQVTTAQKNLGPYKPPSERGGVMGGIASVAKNVLGMGGSQDANASQTKSQYRQAGSTVSADEVAQYAMRHGKTVSQSQSILKGLGYAVGR